MPFFWNMDLPLAQIKCDSFCLCDWPHFLPPDHFSIHLNQFTHSEDGGSTLLSDAGTCNRYMMLKPKTSRIFRMCECRNLRTEQFCHSDFFLHIFC